MSSRISKLTIFIVKDHMSEINKCHYKEIGWYCSLSQRGYYTWLIEWLLLNLQRTAAFQDENKFSISGREQVQYFRTRTSSVLQDENKFSISGREQVQYFRTRTSPVFQDENKFSISRREQVQYFKTRTSSVFQEENKFSISGREQVQ